jgi:thioredoxin-like negative regulator of GroEL
VYQRPFSALHAIMPAPEPKAAFVSAMAIYQSGDLRGAASAFASLCMQWPEWLDARANFAQVVLESGFPAKAFQILEAGLKHGLNRPAFPGGSTP